MLSDRPGAEARRPGGAALAPAGRLALAAVAMLIAAGCARAPHAARPTAGTPIDVQTVRPIAPDGAGAIVLPGRVKADEEVTLTARVSARLTALPRREGDRFRAGQVLAVFDAPEARDAWNAARAAMTAATSRRDRAIVQEARFDSLYAASVVAKSDLELAQVERHAAESALSSARAALASWNEGLRPTAAFDGVVVRRHADVGAVLAPGAAVLDLRSATAREIETAVPESRLDGLDHGRLEFQVGVGPWRPARVVRVDGMTDPATRTRVAHLAPVDGGGALEPGAYVRIRIDAGAGARAAAATPGAGEARKHATGALGVPTASIVRRGSLAGVYVVEDGTARLRWLRLGREDGGRTEVLAGLWRDDAIAVDPSALSDGASVRVTP